jgi:hypothetical protein
MKCKVTPPLKHGIELQYIFKMTVLGIELSPVYVCEKLLLHENDVTIMHGCIMYVNSHVHQKISLYQSGVAIE